MHAPLNYLTIKFVVIAVLLTSLGSHRSSGEDANVVPLPEAAGGSGEAYREKAEAGDALAQAMLADTLYHGIPSDSAFTEAASWAEKSSALGCPVGTAILADMFRTGKGRPLDERKADELAEASREPLLAGVESANAVWLRWAALSPSRKSKYLGTVMGLREGNVSHWGRNLPLMRQAIAAGDDQAAVEWAERLHDWKIEGQEEADRKMVIDALEKARAKRNPAAMHTLGDLYLWGPGVEKDEARAEACYAEAIAAGWAPSRLALARLIILREGHLSRNNRLKELQDESVSPVNSALAAEWYYELETGGNLPRNSAAAAEWLARLEPAQAAIAMAKVIVGRMLAPGATVLSERETELDALFERMLESSPPTQAYRLIHDAALFAGEEASEKWYMRAAMGGIPSAMTDVASQYHEGYLRSQSNVEARKWYRKAVETGDAFATYCAGIHWLKLGEFAEAERLLKESTEKGKDQAWEELGDLCLSGKNGKKRTREAAIHYRKAAAAGSFSAAAKLLYLLGGKQVKPADAKEVQRWNAAIEDSLDQMSPQTRIFLLTNTAREIGRPPFGDRKAALPWWVRAAVAGDLSAANIVMLTEDGVDPKSRSKVFDVVKAAAESSGNTSEMLRVAEAYDEGKGVKANKAEATFWYEAAAEKGDYFALEEIGHRYLKGVGVTKSTTSAIKWFKVAIRKGSVTKMVSLAYLYTDGKYVSPNGAEAVKWFKTAAACGDSVSMYNLCALYAAGELAPRDYVEAYMWANAAAAASRDDGLREKSVEYRRVLEAGMTPVQVQKAQTRTQDFLLLMNTASKILLERVEAGEPVITSFDNPLDFILDDTPEPSPDEPAGVAPMVGSATAWAASSKGHLVTAAHAVKGGNRLTVTGHDGKSHEARLLKADTVNDIAILKIDAPTSPLFLRRTVLMGESVATIGFPNSDLQGNAPKVTEGIVSSLSGPGDDPRMLQISVPVQPGNSGGPLLDRSGVAVGMIQARLSDSKTFAQSGTIPQVVNYAQKIGLIQIALDGIDIPEPVGKGNDMQLPDIVEKSRPSIYLLHIR